MGVTITETIPKKSIVCKMSCCGAVFICNHEDIKILKETHKIQHNSYETETFEVIKCPKCGLNNIRKIESSVTVKITDEPFRC